MIFLTDLNELLSNYIYPIIIFFESHKIILSITFFIIFILFSFKKSKYIEAVFIIKDNSKIHEIEKEYAVKQYINLIEDADTFFIIGFPGNEMKNIKLFEFDKYKKISFRNKFKYKLVKKYSTTIYSDEYLLIQTPESEGIPMYKIKARVNGDIVEFDFSYNGLYGTRDKNYIKVKQSIISLIFNYFS